MKAEKLNKERKRQKLSIAELANKANLPKGTVEKILFGIVKNSRIDTMEAIERALIYTPKRFKAKEKSPIYCAFTVINHKYTGLLGALNRS